MARPLQGTATNSESAQTVLQRAEFGELVGEQSFGASDTTRLAALFTGFDAAVIDSAAKGFMSYTTDTKNDDVIASGQNPDFNGSITNAQLFGFEKGNGKFAQISNAKDGPDIFGPNLSVGDIKLPPVDDNTETAVDNIPSPTKTTGNTADSFSTKGFGVDILRNNPDTDSPVTTGYLDRRDTETGSKLGEYIDSATYQYSNISLDTPDS